MRKYFYYVLIVRLRNYKGHGVGYCMHEESFLTTGQHSVLMIPTFMDGL